MWVRSLRAELGKPPQRRRRRRSASRRCSPPRRAARGAATLTEAALRRHLSQVSADISAASADATARRQGFAELSRQVDSAGAAALPPQPIVPQLILGFGDSAPSAARSSPPRTSRSGGPVGAAAAALRARRGRPQSAPQGRPAAPQPGQRPSSAPAGGVGRQRRVSINVGLWSDSDSDSGEALLVDPMSTSACAAPGRRQPGADGAGQRHGRPAQQRRSLRVSMTRTPEDLLDMLGASGAGLPPSSPRGGALLSCVTTESILCLSRRWATTAAPVSPPAEDRAQAPVPADSIRVPPAGSINDSLVGLIYSPNRERDPDAVGLTSPRPGRAGTQRRCLLLCRLRRIGSGGPRLAYRSRVAARCAGPARVLAAEDSERLVDRVIYRTTGVIREDIPGTQEKAEEVEHSPDTARVLAQLKENSHHIPEHWVDAITPVGGRPALPRCTLPPEMVETLRSGARQTLRREHGVALTRMCKAPEPAAEIVPYSELDCHPLWVLEYEGAEARRARPPRRQSGEDSGAPDKALAAALSAFSPIEYTTGFCVPLRWLADALPQVHGLVPVRCSVLSVRKLPPMGGVSLPSLLRWAGEGACTVDLAGGSVGKPGALPIARRSFLFGCPEERRRTSVPVLRSAHGATARRASRTASNLAARARRVGSLKLFRPWRPERLQVDTPASGPAQAAGPAQMP
eukprot:TRINITY_DN9768_c0_g1_i2.p1 TRINITY_DN9768_c0_g1~~TRINITY_DN9768_c0_g1_i2.p1  ORF type:complete len:711 (+),score=132.11 TRINITY_DN9768_c0_g1_i2:75-2135(+)